MTIGSSKIQVFTLTVISLLFLIAGAKMTLAQSAPTWSTSHGYEPRIVATYNGNLQHYNGTQTNTYYQQEPITVKATISNIQCWVDNVGVGGGDYCVKIYPAFAQQADRAQISAQLDVVGFAQPHLPQCGIANRYFDTSYITPVAQTCWRPSGGGWDGHKLNDSDPGNVTGSIVLIAPGKLGNHYMRFSYNTPQDDIDGIGHNGQRITNVLNETHDVMFKVIPAPTPDNLTVVPGVCDTKTLNLSWDKLSGPKVTGGDPLTGISYNVYHFDGVTATLLTNVTQPQNGNRVTFVESNLIEGNLYAYKVSAVAYGIETPLSAFKAAIAPSPCNNSVNIVTPLLTGRKNGSGDPFMPGPTPQNIQTNTNNGYIDLSWNVTTTTNSPVNCKLQNVTGNSVDIFTDRDKNAAVTSIFGSGTVTAASKAGDGSITNIKLPLGVSRFNYICKDTAAGSIDKSSALTFNVQKIVGALGASCTANGSASDITLPVPATVVYRINAFGGSGSYSYSWDSGPYQARDTDTITFSSVGTYPGVAWSVQDSSGRTTETAYCPKAIVTSGGGGGGGGGSEGIHMWLDNDPGKALENMTIRLGENAPTNSEPIDSGHDYTMCTGRVHHPNGLPGDYIFNLPGGTANHTNGNPVTIPANKLVRGDNQYFMTCDATDISNGQVTRGEQAKTQSGAFYLLIHVFDPNIREF